MHSVNIIIGSPTLVGCLKVLLLSFFLFLSFFFHSTTVLSSRGEAAHQMYTRRSVIGAATIIDLERDRPVNECLTRLPLKVFTKRNFAADFLLLREKYAFRRKMVNLCVLSPLMFRSKQRTLFMLGSLESS